MTLVIDGPIVISRAPSGTLAATHWPVSLPPGRPPVPASAVALGVAVRCPVGAGRLTAMTAIAPSRTGASHSRGPLGSGRRSSAAAARTATAGAAGTRYWKPLTGQTVKKTAGTAIQLARST